MVGHAIIWMSLVPVKPLGTVSTLGLTFAFCDCEVTAMDIRPIGLEHREAVNRVLKEEWNCPPSISRGRAIDTTVLPGFVSLDGRRINGAVTYLIDQGEWEIVTLNSFDENKGIGTALIQAVLDVAKEAKCRRVWLITTNDNAHAIRFYQKKGFEWVATHRNAMEVSRAMKPAIPLLGLDGIPLKHEIEFEIKQ